MSLGGIAAAGEECKVFRARLALAGVSALHERRAASLAKALSQFIEPRCNGFACAQVREPCSPVLQKKYRPDEARVIEPTRLRFVDLGLQPRLLVDDPKLLENAVAVDSMASFVIPKKLECRRCRRRPLASSRHIFGVIAHPNHAARRFGTKPRVDTNHAASATIHTRL